MRMLFRSALALTVLTFVGAAAQAQDAKAVIEKAVKAQGGEDNLKKFPAARVKAKGSMELMGVEIEFSLDSSVQNPDKFRNDINLEVMGQKITIVQVYNGKKGWQSMLGQTMEVEGDQLDDLKEEAYGNYLEQLFPLLHDKQFELKAVDGEKVDDKPTDGVKVTSKGHKDVTLFFDKDSGLLVKSRKKSKDPNGGQEVEAETFYKDYKEVNGTKQSMKQLLKHDGKKFLEAEVTDMKLMDKIDASTFDKP
jgi:hypothetical protein